MDDDVGKYSEGIGFNILFRPFISFDGLDWIRSKMIYKGALWENFIISERKKNLAYTGFYGNTYFWCTVDKAGIDYIEEQDNKLSAFKLKWNSKVKVKFPASFMEKYSPETSSAINRDNFWEFL